ncbi:MAG: glpQ [Vampirovibrio sp.]|jgi:glycerophosphoryl diester phosphodiesterase|nr:glpQ [Vampirovibrio sp.]
MNINSVQPNGLRPVQVIAHRGVRTDNDPNKMAPENTMPAFLEAARQGAAIELDVISTVDGSLRVHHDNQTGRIFQLAGRQKDVHRTTSKEMDYATLNMAGHEATVKQMLGPGSHYRMPAKFSTVTVPELENVLEALPDTHFYVELKVSDPELLRKGDNQLEKRVVQLIKEKNLYDRVTLISFSPHSLRKTKALDPNIKTGLNFSLPPWLQKNELFMNMFVNLYAKRWVKVNSIHPSYEDTNPALVNRAHEAGMSLFTWVNEQTRSEEKAIFPKLLDMQVDGILTNSVDLLNEAVGKPAPISEKASEKAG